MYTGGGECKTILNGARCFIGIYIIITIEKNNFKFLVPFLILELYEKINNFLTIFLTRLLKKSENYLYKIPLIKLTTGKWIHVRSDFGLMLKNCLQEIKLK